MTWILYAASVLWIAAGAYGILYTDRWRALMRRLLENTGRRLLEAATGVGGLLLLLAASTSRVPAVVDVIGVLAIAKAVLLYLNPAGVFEKSRRWYLDELTDQAHRLLGIVSLILGTALLSWVR